VVLVVTGNRHASSLQLHFYHHHHIYHPKFHHCYLHFSNVSSLLFVWAIDWSSVVRYVGLVFGLSWRANNDNSNRRVSSIVVVVVVVQSWTSRSGVLETKPTNRMAKFTHDRNGCFCPYYLFQE
jgi:hypothetical protein